MLMLTASTTAESQANIGNDELWKMLQLLAMKQWCWLLVCCRPFQTWLAGKLLGSWSEHAAQATDSEMEPRVTSDTARQRRDEGRRATRIGRNVSKAHDRYRSQQPKIDRRRPHSDADGGRERAGGRHSFVAIVLYLHVYGYQSSTGLEL